MSRSLSPTDTGHPPLSVKFVTQNKACKGNVSCCYAITIKCATSEWPVKFSEKALDSTRTRKVLICFFFSCFQETNEFLAQFSTHRREQKALQLNKKF